MLKETLGHLNLYGLTEAATVIFLVVFVAVGLVTLLRPKRDIEQMAQLPNEELPQL